MTFLLPYDTLQEEKISNFFLERLNLKSKSSPTVTFLLLYSHLPFIISVLLGLEEKCIHLKLGKSSVMVQFTGGV